MTEKNYFLNIYNTMTGEFELVQVTKEVFQTYRRTKWHIEDSTLLRCQFFPVYIREEKNLLVNIEN